MTSPKKKKQDHCMCVFEETSDIEEVLCFMQLCYIEFIIVNMHYMSKREPEAVWSELMCVWLPACMLSSLTIIYNLPVFCVGLNACISESKRLCVMCDRQRD